MIPLVPTITQIREVNVSLVNQYAAAINAISELVGADPTARAMALQAFDLAGNSPKQLKYAQAVTLYKKDGTTEWTTSDNTLPVTLKAQQSQAKGDVLCTDANQALYLKINEDETANAGLVCNPESAPSAGDGSIVGWVQGDHTEPIPGMSGKFYDGYVLVGAGGAGAGDGTGGASVRLGNQPTHVFPVDLTQVGGVQGTESSPATWTYDVADVLTSSTLKSTVDPVASPHKWQRPSIGWMIPATFGYAHYQPDGSGGLKLVLGWINEMVDQAKCV